MTRGRHHRPDGTSGADATPARDARGNLAERAPASNVVYLAPRRMQQRAGRAYQRVFLRQAIDLFRECEAVCRQAKQLRIRAEVVYARFGCPR